MREARSAAYGAVREPSSSDRIRRQIERSNTQSDVDRHSRSESRPLGHSDRTRYMIVLGQSNAQTIYGSPRQLGIWSRGRFDGWRMQSAA